MTDPIIRRSNNSTPTKDTNTTRTRRDNYSAQNIRNNQSSDSEFEESNESIDNTIQNQPVKYRIGSVAALMLLFVAGFFDVLELALDALGTFGFGVGVVIGYLKDAISFVFFPFMFFVLGAPFWKGKKAKKKMIAMVTGFLISMVPWLGAIMPETLISVAVTIYLTRSEDKGRAKNAAGNVGKNIVRAKRTKG